jgi:hypothetical protein
MHKVTWVAAPEILVVAPSFFRKLGYFLVFTYKKRDGDGLAWNVQRNIMRHSLQLAKKRFQSPAAQQFFATAVLDAAGKKVTWFHKIMYEMRDELFARAVDRNVSLSRHAPRIGIEHVRALIFQLVRLGTADASTFACNTVGTLAFCGRAGELGLAKWPRFEMEFTLSPTGTPVHKHL